MNNVVSAPVKPQILIVDDTPENLQILCDLLIARGYAVRAAPDGKFALNFVQKQLPDLILLDVLMPELNGYDVCQQLQADERTREIPVIFLSALGEIDDKIKGFTVGGVDYITKPFQAEDVLARVDTHLSLRRVRQELQQELIDRRQVEQALLEANASKDKFFSIIAHDLRNPFTSLLGLTEVLVENFERYDGAKIKLMLTHLHSASKTLYDLLKNLLEWSRLERGLLTPEPTKISLTSMVNMAMQVLADNAARKEIRLKNLLPAECTVYADLKMIQTVIRNLLSNALKFTPTGGVVTISARQQTHEVEITVADTGVGIPPENLSHLFRIDTKTSSQGTAGEEGTGLGLILCKELVEKNGGAIHVESEPSRGSRFWFTLPCQPRAKND
jgi:two-component system, sensor histidine kinase and response regulator